MPCGLAMNIELGSPFFIFRHSPCPGAESVRVSIIRRKKREKEKKKKLKNLVIESERRTK